MDNGLQESPKDEDVEKSRYSQALEVLKALESVESVEPLALPRKRVSLSTVSDVRGKEYIQMKKSEAVARVTIEHYQELHWIKLEELNPSLLKESEDFMKNAFKALTLFVLYLYGEEFFNDIAAPITDAERVTIFEFIYGTENPKNSLSELGIYLDKFRNIREPDVGNIIEWYTKAASRMPEEELPCFTSRTLYHPQSMHRCAHQYVSETRKIIEERKYGLEREVMRHLMMELTEAKCFCIIDALYMEAWKRIPIASLEGGVLEEDMLHVIASIVHGVFNDVIEMRTTRLCKDRDLVKATLSLFGSCDDDVRQVVEWADLERRTQRRRFINKDDLFTSLYQNILGDGLPFGCIKYLSSSDVDTKNDRTVFQVYQRSEVIAKKEGKQNIGLEHLYIALMNERVDNESSWDKFKIWVRMTKSKNKHKTGAEAQLWRKVHNNSGDGAREFKKDYLTVVRNIQDDNFSPLKDVIASILPKEVVLGKGFPEKNTKLRFVLRS